VPIPISYTDSTDNFPGICVDRFGKIHAVWDTRRFESEIYYNYKDSTGWHTSINLSNSPTLTSRCPDIISDTLGHLHVAYFDYESGRIKWTYFNGDTWTTPVSISSDVPYACVCPRLSLNPLDNTIHSVWHDWSGPDAEIWYKYYDGTNWSSVENVSNDNDDSGWPDIAIDSLGRLHVVWMDYGTWDIFYRMKDSSGWGSVIHLEPYISSYSCDPCIAIDLNNNPHIVWEERSSPEYVIYTYFDGLVWKIIKVDSANAGVQWPVIAMDMYDRAHIIYFKDYKLYYVCYEETTKIVGPEMINPSEPGYALVPAIAVDNQYLRCLFSEGITGNEIWYSYREIPSCVEEIERYKVSSIVYNNKFSFSFSLDKPSYVRLSIFDITGRKIKVIRFGRLEKGKYRKDIRLEIPSGIYFLILEGDGRKKIGKIIKM
jgi:hypothetical protein